MVGQAKKLGWLLIVSVFLLGDVRAWNRPGHMTTGAIAYRVMQAENPDAAHKLIEILRAHPEYHSRWEPLLEAGSLSDDDRNMYLFMLAARWPDDIRGDEEYHHGNWHFINYPYSPPGPPSGTPLAPAENVNHLDSLHLVRAIEHNLSVLRHGGDVSDRAVATCWLLHLIGDAHQPLHTAKFFSAAFPAPNGDRGGTWFHVRPTAHTSPQSLHQYWDDILIKRDRFRTVRNLAGSLRQQYSLGSAELAVIDPVEWTRESFRLAVDVGYRRGGVGGTLSQDAAPVLPTDYADSVRPVAERQAVLAGHRTASVLAAAVAGITTDEVASMPDGPEDFVDATAGVTAPDAGSALADHEAIAETDEASGTALHFLEPGSAPSLALTTPDFRPNAFRHGTDESSSAPEGLGLALDALEARASSLIDGAEPGSDAPPDHPDVAAPRLAARSGEAGPGADGPRVSASVADRTYPEAYQLPSAADPVFSEAYRRIRSRYLSYFFFEGMTATTLQLKDDANPASFNSESVAVAEFGDQTLHMGQALLAFAGESAVLRHHGVSTDASEAVLGRLLAAFQELDDADGMQETFGASRPGFFLRDLVYDEKRRGVPSDWRIKSDSKSAIQEHDKMSAAMSLDQVVSLLVGWWAVNKYSENNENRTHARQQCERVINFLRESLFLIRLPNGETIPADRGSECRYAAGFLCRMAEAVTGEDYFNHSDIDITIKGDPIRFRDDNLGEFEIPGYKIPAKVPVRISHPLVVALTPAVVAVMTTPAIKIRFSDLFPGEDTNVNLPCAHVVQAHPEGHRNMIPCVHLTSQHPEGDLVATLPCAHLERLHPDGDSVPCAHLTAKHPGGHPVTLPCAHIGQLHPGGHDKRVAGIRVHVPCTHIGPMHSGGHTNHVACHHLVPKHPNGHRVDCVHLTPAHPEGHKQYVPCVHPTAVHPEGDPVDLPCPHYVQAHPSGHGFDLRDLDVNIPLGERVPTYSRHIALQCFSFERAVNGVTDFLPTAMSSDHPWSLLLRARVLNDIPAGLFSAQIDQDLEAMPLLRGPDNQNSRPWTRSNRWERCTDLAPHGDGPEVYNGLDFLSFEVLSRLIDDTH